MNIIVKIDSIYIIIHQSNQIFNNFYFNTYNRMSDCDIKLKIKEVIEATILSIV